MPSRPAATRLPPPIRKRATRSGMRLPPPRPSSRPGRRKNLQPTRGVTTARSAALATALTTPSWRGSMGEHGPFLVVAVPQRDHQLAAFVPCRQPTSPSASAFAVTPTQSPFTELKRLGHRAPPGPGGPLVVGPSVPKPDAPDQDRAVGPRAEISPWISWSAATSSVSATSSVGRSPAARKSDGSIPFEHPRDFPTWIASHDQCVRGAHREPPAAPPRPTEKRQRFEADVDDDRYHHQDDEDPADPDGEPGRAILLLLGEKARHVLSSRSWRAGQPPSVRPTGRSPP